MPTRKTETLESLYDVATSAKASGDYLAWDEATNRWVNVVPPTPPRGTVSFADDAARTAVGQIGVQLDDGTLWYATALTAGAWSLAVATAAP